MGDFIAGMIAGGLGVLIIVGAVVESEKVTPLKKCAKTHNVYQCEWVAVPVEVK